MNAYEALAFSYDALTYDVPYPEIAAFFERVLKRSGVEAQTVLDLACGTGSLSVLLAARGYRVLGVDCSEEMLTVASEKAAELALAHAAPEDVICAVGSLYMAGAIRMDLRRDHNENSGH